MSKNFAKRRLYFLLALVLLLLAAAALAEHLAPCDPYAQDLGAALLAPSADHLLGTDRYGRDLFSRILLGARTSIFSALALVLLISTFGTLMGTLAALLGGKIDSALMRLSDVCLAFPGLVLAMALAAVLDAGLLGAVLALAAVSWPKYARLARGRTLSLLSAPFIYAARLAGDTRAALVLRHILPNIAGVILVTAMLDLGTMLMELAGLSFLGLGAQPPAAEWGQMMSAGRSMLQTHPWVVLAPGAAIFLTVMLFNLLGDAARDALDPKHPPVRIR